MWWKNLSYERKGAIITALTGIFAWIVFFASSPFNNDMAGPSYLLFFVIAVFSIIPLWLIGLLIGNKISKQKKSWKFYFFVILGIIITMGILIRITVWLIFG
jgi:hypothetical protein